MRLAIALARENVERQTGGPFGAAVFDEKGHLVAPGVNVVVTGNCSILHAEMVAIALAQKKLARYDIGDEGRSHYTLAASTEPCAMCFGAIPWSGVTRLECGARDEDARRRRRAGPVRRPGGADLQCGQAWVNELIRDVKALV